MFLVSLVLVMRTLATGEGEAAANLSVVAKTLVLYAIMVTGSIWEKSVFGRYLFAPAFFWEDVVSMAVLALHTAYLAALGFGLLDTAGLMWLALAAYLTYAVNATQFLLKLRAARLQAPARLPSMRGRPDERPRAPPEPNRDRLRRRRDPPGARAAGGVLRAHRHRLASPQDPGRVLPRRRLAHLRPPDPVGRGRDDLRRAALRHRDHRRARPRGARRHERRARPGGRAADRAPARHPAPVPRRLLPLGGDQARSRPGGDAPVA